MDLQSLVRVSLTSKLWGDICEAELKNGSLAHTLLRECVTEAAEAATAMYVAKYVESDEESYDEDYEGDAVVPYDLGSDVVEDLNNYILHYRKELEWLLEKAGSTALLLANTPLSIETVRVVSSTPNLPRSMAGILVSAGLRVPYKHLMEAASKGAKGFSGSRVLVEACNDMGLPSGLPQHIEQLCCHHSSQAVPEVGDSLGQPLDCSPNDLQRVTQRLFLAALWPTVL
jgi:hypothetical protein